MTTLTSKTRLGKRKQEVKEIRKENQTTTSKKHDKKCLETNKSATKEVLSEQIIVLQGKIDQLEEETRTHYVPQRR